MKRHTRLLALLLLAALLTGCGSKAPQPKEADAAVVQTALPPEGITALVLSDDTQVLRFRRDGDIWYWNGYENEFIGYGADGYIDTDAGRKDAIIAEGGTADGGS